MPPIPLSTLNGYTSSDDLVSAIGSIYEHSPWISSSTFSSAPPPYSSLTALHTSLKATVSAATQEQKLNLVNAHPDLAGKAALSNSLTAESASEQSRAGLTSLSTSEMSTFTSLNAQYKEKFSHVFILAVRNASKHAIINAMRARLNNSPETELGECLTQIHKIAWMRLLDLVEPNPTGFLTCHVLDTACGCPAAGMRVTLSRLSGAGPVGHIAEFLTNEDGRLPGGPALKGLDFSVGAFEWVFFVGDYFLTKAGQTVSGQPFLGEVPIRFGIDNPEDHYHVPLLCSPFSFSTYRGS